MHGCDVLNKRGFARPYVLSEQGQNFGKVAKANLSWSKLVQISGVASLPLKGQGQLLGVVKRSRPKNKWSRILTVVSSASTECIQSAKQHC